MHSNQQHPGPYGPAQPYQQTAQPYPQTVIVQKKGGGCLKAVLISAGVLMGIIVLAAIFSGGGSGGDSDTTTTATSNGTSAKPADKAADKAADKPKQADKPKTPGIGDLVKDGKFAFKVTKVEKGLSQVGEGFMVSKAQGQYVLVHLNVKNIGDKAQMFTGSAQKLIDTQGRQFDADSGAAIGMKDSNAFLNNINPGNTVNGIVLFDVPKDFKIKSIELHDSFFSGGVTVTLR
ncbi:DUF4352 domain-containing protein [Sphaerimonospora thailandensis]|uniref:DUF4352 domain-containing protein n=1 Tax=Sphaerimonospora thailandensis TaxID=795644 RepID=A0A8J3W1V2_9ACTN|nr:DUF4352 domain-containing protein [Sphaerimonospora thailandensis]GIH72620.1 hypothetical protein Mth01_48730 [Sphaerimonospora thailandensis]